MPTKSQFFWTIALSVVTTIALNQLAARNATVAKVVKAA